MKKLFITILMLSAVASFAQSALYPLPASWSFRAVASFSQPRIVATTTETPIASAGNNDIVFFNIGSDTLMLRANKAIATPAWEVVPSPVATFPRLIPSVASPSGTVATGTLWMDATGTVRIYRNGTFEEL